MAWRAESYQLILDSRLLARLTDGSRGGKPRIHASLGDAEMQLQRSRSQGLLAKVVWEAGRVALGSVYARMGVKVVAPC